MMMQALWTTEYILSSPLSSTGHRLWTDWGKRSTKTRAIY